MFDDASTRPKPIPALLSQRAAARYFGISAYLLSQLMRRGELEVVTVRRHRKIVTAKLIQLLGRRDHAGPA